MTNTAFVASSRRTPWSQVGAETLAPIITLTAVLVNFILCFVNTNLHIISPHVVIAAEAVLIGTALALVWNKSVWLYAILVLLAAYFYTIMTFRFQFDPKIVRDTLIPIAFLFLGFQFGSLRSADRLVTLLLVVALGVAIFEWLAVDTYLHYFNVARYYVDRGTATQDQHQYVHGFFNSTRFESRTLFPFLGDHRVSGIFLEAPSVGNFGAITFAWILLRPGGVLPFLAKSVAILVLIVLADARFGFYFCLVTLLVYMAAPVIRPTMLFIAPFLAMIALVVYADAQGIEAFTNDMSGRIVLAGRILSSIDIQDLFGLQASNISTGVRFASDPVNDSAYTYVLLQLGLIGAAALWALFVYSPVANKDAWRFKCAMAFYYALVLSIAASAFTIKTAALLWFLYGTLNNVGMNSIARYGYFSRSAGTLKRTRLV